MTAYIYLREFIVVTEHLDEFEHHYGRCVGARMRRFRAAPQLQG